VKRLGDGVLRVCVRVHEPKTVGMKRLGYGGLRVCARVRDKKKLSEAVGMQVFDTDQDFKTWFSKPFALPEQEEQEEEASAEEQMVLINRLHQVHCFA
jgi:hypothetical protein